MARFGFKSSKNKGARKRLPDKENETPQVVIQVDATKEEAVTEEVATTEPAEATRKTANVSGALRAHAKLQRAAQPKPMCWVDDDDAEGHCICPIS